MSRTALWAAMLALLLLLPPIVPAQAVELARSRGYLMHADPAGCKGSGATWKLVEGQGKAPLDVDLKMARGRATFARHDPDDVPYLAGRQPAPDVSFYVDTPRRELLAYPGNVLGDDAPLAAFEKLEVRWEDHAQAAPRWAWPQADQAVTVIGSWITTCAERPGGVKPTGHRTLLKPVVLLATERGDVAEGHAFEETLGEVTHATRIDVFASNRAGAAGDALGLRAPGLAAGLQELRGSSFTVQLPAPRGAAPYVHDVVGRLAGDSPTQGDVSYQMTPTSTGYNLTITFGQDTGWMAFGASIYVGRAGTAQEVGRVQGTSLQRYRVTPVGLEVTDTLCARTAACRWNVSMTVGDEHVVLLDEAVAAPMTRTLEGARSVEFSTRRWMGPVAQLRAYAHDGVYYEPGAASQNLSADVLETFLEPTHASHEFRVALRDPHERMTSFGMDRRCWEARGAACVYVTFRVELLPARNASVVTTSWSPTDPPLVGETHDVTVSWDDPSWGSTEFDGLALPAAQRPTRRTHSGEGAHEETVRFTVPATSSSLTIRLRSADGTHLLQQLTVPIVPQQPHLVVKLSNDTPRAGVPFSATVTTTLGDPYDATYSLDGRSPEPFTLGQPIPLSVHHDGTARLSVTVWGTREGSTGPFGATLEFPVANSLELRRYNHERTIDDVVIYAAIVPGTWEAATASWRDRYGNVVEKEIPRGTRDITFEPTQVGPHSLTVRLESGTGSMSATSRFYVQESAEMSIILPAPAPTWFRGDRASAPPPPPVEIKGVKTALAEPVRCEGGELELDDSGAPAQQFVTCSWQMPWDNDPQSHSYVREVGWQAPGHAAPAGWDPLDVDILGSEVLVFGGDGSIIPLDADGGVTLPKRYSATWQALADARFNKAVTTDGVYAPSAGGVVLAPPEGEPVIFDAPGVERLVADARTGAAFGLAPASGLLYRFEPDGSLDSVDAGDLPVDVAIDDASGALLVADHDGKALRAFGPDLAPLGQVALDEAPIALDVLAANGKVFVAESGAPEDPAYDGLLEWDEERRAEGPPRVVIVPLEEFGFSREELAADRPAAPVSIATPATPATPGSSPTPGGSPTPPASREPTPGERDSWLPLPGAAWLALAVAGAAILARRRASR